MVTPETMELRRIIQVAKGNPYEKETNDLFIRLGCPVYYQHIIGYYICDFVGRDRLFVLEIDGDSHTKRVEQDARRDAFLLSCGFDTYRLSREEISLENLSGIIAQNPIVGTRKVEALLATANKIATM